MIGLYLYALLLAFTLGLSIAAPPGPINMTVLAETIRFGGKRGVMPALGATTADAFFYVLTRYFGGLLQASRALTEALYVAGIVLLVYLSASFVRGAREPTRLGAPDLRIGYLKGLSIGLVNPLQIGWWVVVGLPLIAVLGNAYFAPGFFAGILSWVLGFTYLVQCYRERVWRYLPLISVLSAITFLGFAAYFGLRLYRAL